MQAKTYPRTIAITGESITFEGVVIEDGVEKAILKNNVKPNAGPPFHVHFLQDEGLTVRKGKLGYQVVGGKEKFAGPGESVQFDRGVGHRFWNAGDDIMECDGWIKPAHNIEYFLTGIYASMNKAGNPKGDLFDTAFLIRRYRKEFDMLVIPPFVKNIIMPLTVFIGKILGKYKHFKDAPPPAA